MCRFEGSVGGGLPPQIAPGRLSCRARGRRFQLVAGALHGAPRVHAGLQCSSWELCGCKNNITSGFCQAWFSEKWLMKEKFAERPLQRDSSTRRQTPRSE